MSRFLFALVLTSSFSLVGFAQTEESPEVVVPEQAMEQVVRRVLVWYFKPRNQEKVVYLADKGLQKSWLPRIEGIEFRLLSETEVAKIKGVYFFTEIEKLPKNKFHIGFAFGDSSCSYFGESWNFRISNQRVRLWQTNKVFGQSCSYTQFRNGYGSLITPQSNKLLDARRKQLSKFSALQISLTDLTIAQGKRK